MAKIYGKNSWNEKFRDFKKFFIKLILKKKNFHFKKNFLKIVFFSFHEFLPYFFAIFFCHIFCNYLVLMFYTVKYFLFFF